MHDHMTLIWDTFDLQMSGLIYSPDDTRAKGSEPTGKQQSQQ